MGEVGHHRQRIEIPAELLVGKDAVPGIHRPGGRSEDPLGQRAMWLVDASPALRRVTQGEDIRRYGLPIPRVRAPTVSEAAPVTSAVAWAKPPSTS